ncbi:hypothetical protein D1646_06385 [Pseudoflavonifractor sp. 60]|uniref:hypothetical protein n=1 Tax=Pseudoflavonifractor sp. 60 TaxID=2304576 RepID=UPI001367FF50|nr:hypothetical protein [Pseudoflavonifractor sp. 60]NBI66446.1 hypothetical protein [Pseudoflavonifractor sp. 60]
MMDLRPKQIKAILLSLGVIVFAVLFLAQERKEWYLADYDFESLSEIDVSVSAPSDCVLNVHLKNESSLWYYFSPRECSVEKMRDGHWMYWAKEPFGERTTRESTLVGTAMWSCGEADFEVDLREHLTRPDEPGLYWITFFFTSVTGVVYQKSAEFVLT